MEQTINNIKGLCPFFIVWFMFWIKLSAGRYNLPDSLELWNGYKHALKRNTAPFGGVFAVICMSTHNV